MKFLALPIGSRFLYNGTAYIKTSPIIAHAVDGGQQVLMKRYAEVGIDAEAAAVVPMATSPEQQRLQAAVEEMYTTCLDVVRSVLDAVNSKDLEEIGQRLQLHKQAILVHYQEE